MNKLSVVLATRNEESNISRCLKSVKSLADETIVVDEESTDKTREIARSLGAKVYKTRHEPIFHKTKQKALDLATGDWILQLDADEIVTRQLAEEIKKVIGMSSEEVKVRKTSLVKQRLFTRHQEVVEQRDGAIGKPTGEVVAFFIPRRNLFLGKPLIHAGVYPDAVIRLVKRGKAHFPAKSVHEQIEIEGQVAWLFNDLLHNDSPTMERYLVRFNRYTDLHAAELAQKKVPLTLFQLFNYSTIQPLRVFVNLYLRHKGILDGFRGFLWSFYSALHFPVAYFKYWETKYGEN